MPCEWLPRKAALMLKASGRNLVEASTNFTLMREKCLSDALQLSLPGLSTHVRLVLSLCADLTTNAPELSGALLRDYALTLLMLRQAHSAFFAMEIKETVSMRHIVVLLGLDNVTKIVLSCQRMPVDGQPARRFKASALGYLMARSVLAGTMANHLAHLVDVDSEKLAVCAMSFWLGEVAMAGVRPKTFDILWKLRRTPRNMERLARKMTGWKPDALGVELARRWDLPEAIRQVVVSKARGNMKPDPSDPPAMWVSYYVNSILHYAGMGHKAHRRQKAAWGDLKHFLKSTDKRLSHLTNKALAEFKEKNPFYFDILWEQHLLPNLLV